MKELETGARTLLFLILTIAGICFIQMERAATNTLRALGTELPARVDAQLATLSTNLNARVDDAIGKADSRLGDSLAIVRKTEADANAQIAGARADVMSAIETADDRLASVQDDTRPLIKAYAAIPDRVSAQIMPYWECTRLLPNGGTRTGNAACWPSEITGTMGAARTFMGQTAAASRTFEASFPHLLQLGDHMLTTGDAIETDVKVGTDVVANFSKRVGNKPHWYDRIIGLAPTTIRAWEAVK